MNKMKKMDKIDKISYSEIYLRNLIEILPYYIFWKDINFVYRGCNRKFASLFNIKLPSEIIGKTDYELGWSSTKEADLFRQGDIDVLNGHLVVNQEETIINNDGSRSIMLVNKLPITNGNGECIGILGTSIDITRRKIAEENLLAAKKIAEEANKVKSEFIANISHDLLTPLTGVMGMAEDMLITAQQNEVLLKGTNVLMNEYARKLIDEMIHTVQQDSQMLASSADELIQVYNEILETISIESGKTKKVIEAFNIHELIQDNIKMLLPAAKHKGLTLTYEIAENVPVFINGLQTYLDRSLLNLISNALKFTNEGFVKVKVNLDKKSKKMHSFKLGDEIILTIAIEDSGIGIPKDKFAVIFEHFSRLTASYQGLYKGAGLGLYTVKLYVHAMGGKIKVESEVGKGSTFILTLPLTVNDHADRAKKPIVGIKKQENIFDDVTPTGCNHQTKGQSASILIVEDSAIAAMSLQKKLQKQYGIKSNVVSNGEDAIEMARENSYDLILMDIGLPDMSGIEAAKTIRQVNQETPIVAVTGHAGNPSKRKEILDSGIQAIFNKPPTDEELKILLEKYIVEDQKATVPPASFSQLNQEIIDMSATLALYSNDTQLVRQILNLLSDNLHKAKKTCIKAYEAHDIDTLRFELHQLKGSVSYVKVPQLFSAISAFYRPIENEYDGQLQHLENEYRAFIKAIDAYQAVWKK